MVIMTKLRPGQGIEHLLFKSRRGHFAIWKERFEEERQIQICAISFRDKKPKERYAGIFGVDGAHEAGPAKRQLLLAPVSSVHNRVARAHGADGPSVNRNTKNLLRRKSTNGARGVAQNQYAVFFRKVPHKLLRRNAVIVASENVVHGLDAFRRDLRHRNDFALNAWLSHKYPV